MTGLFPDCAVPGCVNPTDTQGHPCPSCRTAFGDYLTHHPHGVPMTAEQQTARDTEVRAAYTAHRAILAEADTTRLARTLAIEAGAHAKPGQTCWICEQRRSCHRIAVDGNATTASRCADRGGRLDRAALRADSTTPDT
ncbi:hypothetical protein [uncultured Gordonia sp.]|uniref:hypothetical protein n=1 Tax=uncultured Gordonia sp. TaxID=198437 RepID=UPI002587C5EB|nr:hypothetical protein [uncultured Gordonia sp.]